MRRILAVGLLFTTLASAEWVTPHGKAYHSKRECIALRTTKEPAQITVKEAEARGLKPCGICNRSKKGDK